VTRPAITAYDLIAIGSGPAGQHAAIQAAKLGKRVAVVERESALGGLSTNFGTLPSKTLRAAVIELTGEAHGVYRNAYRLKEEVTRDDLLWRTEQVIEHERDAVYDQLRRNRVDVLVGSASFVDPRTLELRSPTGSDRVAADRFVVAVGTTPARPAGVDFDDRTVLDSNGMLRLARVPRTLTVIGGGVIGLEYASMAAALGVHVTVVEKRPRILGFVEDELVDGFQYHLRGLGVVFRLGEEAEAVERLQGGRVVTRLSSGTQVVSEVVLFTAGRRGATADLGLAAAGLEADARGRISVGPDLRTSQPHIFAAGDVIGFPNLASSSMEQGRRAALAAFGEPTRSFPELLPYGVYTIPEISFVGPGERELAERAVPYAAGFAHYRELVRGEIAGDRAGLLKLLVHAETRQTLAVHIFGTSATELVHVGQTAIAAGLTVDYLADAVFNMPTFTDGYRVAALDAAGRLDALKRKRAA
jgi:NAD(P) transhydrogenase